MPRRLWTGPSAMISEGTVKELVEALKEEYGKEVSFDDASRILTDLVMYYDTLARVSHRGFTGYN